MKYVVLLLDDRYAHKNLPTLRKLNMMMQVGVRVGHVGLQYINGMEIWQVPKLGFFVNRPKEEFM